MEQRALLLQEQAALAQAAGKMAKISELKTGQGKADIEAKVLKIEGTRSFNKFGRELKVANALIEDASGTIKLTLWNDEIMKVNTGDIVKITNAHQRFFINAVSEFR